MTHRLVRWATGSNARKFFIVCLAVGILCALFIELYFGTWLSSASTSRLLLLRDVDYTFDVSNLYQATGPIHYRRDSYGLRGAYPDLAHIDILTVGGSATDQRFVGEGQTWQDALARAFSQSGRTINVVNAGLDGQSTVGNILNFDLWFPELPGFRPRYVLMYVGVNDLFTGEGSANDDLAGRSTLKSIVKSKSGFYRLSWALAGTYQAMFRYPLSHRRVDFAAEAWTDRGLQEDYGFLAPRLQAFEGRLRTLSQRIRTLGAVPIYVTQTSRLYKRTGEAVLGSAKGLDYEGRAINGLDVFRMLRRLHETTMRTCRDAQGICIDLDGELHFEGADFYDYFHNTPAGCAKIGAYLFARLQSRVDGMETTGASRRLSQHH